METVSSSAIGHPMSQPGSRGMNPRGRGGIASFRSPLSGEITTLSKNITNAESIDASERNTLTSP